MKFKILFLLLLVVFLSGCTREGTQWPGLAAGGTGTVVITGFSPLESTVEPGAPVYLTLSVKNNAADYARSVSAQLIGIDDWSVSPGRVQSIGDLTPSIRGVEGEEREILWTLYAPERETTGEPIVRVTYSYTSTLTVDLRAVTYDWYRQTGQKGGIRSQTLRGGPLAIKARLPSSIISAGRVSITFEIQNTGGGRVFTGSAPVGDALDRLYVTVSGANCPRTDVILTKGRGATLFCFIDTTGVMQARDYTITLSTSYNYFIDSTTSIKVLPKIPV